MDSYRTLGGGSIDGYFGKNPDWSKIKVKTGRTIWSSYDDNTLQAWLVEDTNAGGVFLAGGNYANPIQIAGNGLPRIAGYFASGFVFENPNQVGVDASGNSWQYVGTSPLPYTVNAGTVPSDPDYEKVFDSTASNVTNANGGSVQDYINKNLTPFKTVADMRSYNYASVSSGSRIEWQGYYSQSDGGSNWGVLSKGDSTALTDDGGSIFIIVNDAVNGVWIEANLKGKTVNPLKFGASAYPADSTSQIQNTLNHSKSVKFTRGVYGYTTLSISEGGIINLSGSTLKQIEYSGDGVIVDGENALIKNGIVDQNDSPTNINNDGIKINSGSCKLIDVTVNGYFYAIDVRADNCILDRTVSNNALYAGVRLFVNDNFEKFSLLNHRSNDYAVKGFVVNGTGYIETIVVDNYSSSVYGVVSPSDAMSDFLIDSGESVGTVNVGVCNILNSSSKTAGSGNKILNTRKLIIENTELTVEGTYNASYGLYSTANTILKDVEMNDRLQAHNVVMDRLSFKDCVTGLANLIILTGSGDKADIVNLDYSNIGTTISGQVIRLDRGLAKDEFIKIGNILGDGVSTLLGVFTAPTNRAGFFELQGSLENVGSIASVSVYREALFVRIDKDRRRFGARTTPPTTGTYNVGDIYPIANLTPSSSYSEYVCVTSGTPGTWAYQNPITSI